MSTNKGYRLSKPGILFYGICVILAAYLATGCDSDSDNGARQDEGFLVVQNVTSEGFVLTLTGHDLVVTNRTVTTVDQINPVTNVTTAADGVTLITNVVNVPVATTITNAVIETLVAEPIVRNVPAGQRSRFPLRASTYQVLVSVVNSIRGGETSVVIERGKRTELNVLLDPNDGTQLIFSVDD